MNKGYVYAIIAVAFFAISSGILIPFITLSPFTIYGVGASFGVLFLLLFQLISKRKLPNLFYHSKKTLLLMVGVGLFIAINNGIYFTGLKSGVVANAALSHYLAPVIVAFILAPLFLKEKLTRKTIICTLLSMIGLVILSIPSLGRMDLALIYGTVSAVFYAIHIVLEKQVAETNMDVLTAMIYKNLIPCIVYLPFAIGGIVRGISFNNWLLLVVFGLLVLGVAFILFFKGIRTISATNASILLYGEPIGAILLASVFLRQPINVYVILGGLLIIGSSIIVVTNKK